jgi:hypothetical protein
MVLLGGDEAQVLARAEGGQHAVGGGALVVVLEELAEAEHVVEAELVPGHGLGGVDRGGAACDRLQGGELGRRELAARPLR